MIYLDGSALCRFLPGVRHYEAFGAWARDHGDELVTTQLGLTELRQAAELYPRSAAERVLGIVETVRSGVAVIRFSDDNVAISSHATAVLKPFAALHVGAAVSHDKVDTIATYDPALASVARIYDLSVVSPGLPQDWYAEYEGPSEHWKPVALDAPYAPGAEFDTLEMGPKVDAYEDALREAEAEAAAKDVARAAHGAAEALTEPQAGHPSEIAEADHGARKSATEVPEGEVTEFEQALREAEDAARASEERSAQESDLDAEPAAEPGQAGIETYHPRVEAWRAGDDDGHDSVVEPEDESGEPGAEGEGEPRGGGLPWTQRPEPEADTPPASPPLAPPPLLRSEEHTIESEGSLPEAPPALAPLAPVEPTAVPNLPREQRGVPPVAPVARQSTGSPARRPMFETEPRPDSRASRPPDPVPPTPPEESKPLTVPIKWNVELDEPEAYAPVRVESTGVRALPSFPVSFAGGQGGLTLESPGSVSVPALEPRGAARSAYPADEVVRSRADRGASSESSARQRKAAEKAAKKERERLDKLAKKSKGAAPPAPTPTQRASVPPESSPTESSDAWKLDDVVSFGKQKKKDA